MMKQTAFASVAAIAAFALAPSAMAQQADVDVFSTEDAEEMLADPVGDEECPVRLEDGSCAREAKTRGFSFAKPKASGSSSSSTTTTRSRAPAASSNRSERVQAASTRRTARTSVAPGARTQAPQAREVPLQFRVGSSDLSPQSKTNLADLAKALNSDSNKMKRILITGHTDKSGTRERNEELSQERADAAAAYLATVGVDRARIEAKGMAFDKTLPGFSEYSPRNRRVEVERIE